VKGKKMINMNNIISGVNTLDANLVGRSVSDVRNMLSQPLNIDPASKPIVNGETVNEDYVLCGGDELEFVKASGEKGC
jgi:hypothetical protein